MYYLESSGREGCPFSPLISAVSYISTGSKTLTSFGVTSLALGHNRYYPCRFGHWQLFWLDSCALLPGTPLTCWHHQDQPWSSRFSGRPFPRWVRVVPLPVAPGRCCLGTPGGRAGKQIHAREPTLLCFGVSVLRFRVGVWHTHSVFLATPSSGAGFLVRRTHLSESVRL